MDQRCRLQRMSDPFAPQTQAPRALPATNEWGAPAFAAAVPEPEGDSLYAAEAQAGAEAAELTAAEDAAALADHEPDEGRSEWPG